MGICSLLKTDLETLYPNEGAVLVGTGAGTGATSGPPVPSPAAHPPPPQLAAVRSLVPRILPPLAAVSTALPIYAIVKPGLVPVCMQAAAASTTGVVAGKRPHALILRLPILAFYLRIINTR